MFGTNKITGQAAFKQAPLNSLLVHSITCTLEGEGPTSGMLTIMIRLAYCNLACSFCDTPFDHGWYMTFDQIQDACLKLLEGDRLTGPISSNRVVLSITGGEPTLQQNLTGFLYGQMPLWKKVKVESNGLIERMLPLGTILVVSPKVAELRDQSNPHAAPTFGRYLRPLPAVLQRADFLKFLIDADPASPYYSIPLWAHAHPDQVFISPMNHYLDEVSAAHREGPLSMWDEGLIDKVRARRNHEYAAKFCMDWGLRLSLQTHLFASLP